MCHSEIIKQTVESDPNIQSIADLRNVLCEGCSCGKNRKESAIHMAQTWHKESPETVPEKVVKIAKKHLHTEEDIDLDEFITIDPCKLITEYNS